MNPWCKRLIWLEGLIGAGKSTAAKEIGTRLNLRVLEEPVTTNPYLACFYKDPARYAFGMQMFMLHQRYALQQLASYECTGVGNSMEPRYHEFSTVDIVAWKIEQESIHN
jgi:deoxyadenosine/deoxycytidine kinase